MICTILPSRNTLRALKMLDLSMLGSRVSISTIESGRAECIKSSATKILLAVDLTP